MFQKQLLMILGLAWIADSMEVMIVSVFHQLQQRHADIGFPARLFWSASALGLGRFETRSVPADHSNVKHMNRILCCYSQLSFLGPELVCEWEISSSTEGLLTTLVFVGMMM